MRLNTKILPGLCLCLFAAILAPQGLASTAVEPIPVGKIILVKGVVVVKNDPSGKRLAEPEGPIFMDDLIKTKKDARVVIRFKDATQIHVGPSSRLKITKYLFDEKKNSVSALFDLLRGQLHVLTGKAGDSRAMIFRTKNSAAGIRGTDFEMAYWRRLRFSFVAVNHGAVKVENTKTQDSGNTIESGQCGWVIQKHKASEPKPMAEAPKWFKPIGDGEKDPPPFVEPWPNQAREEMPGYNP